MRFSGVAALLALILPAQYILVIQPFYELLMLVIALQEEHKTKDEFLANTSHELRNPLHSILKVVSEREESSLNKNSIKVLETVQAVGHHMSLPLNDLLETMNLKEGKPKLQLQDISIHPIITGVIDMLQYMTEGKSVRFINKIPENFPDVYADENWVIQIVFNLLHNAVKHTSEGKIIIEGDVKGDRAQIIISDTGIGIEENILLHVFKPYEQGRQAQVEIGLGLCINKQLVELHGGTLQAHSVLGEGSEFSFPLQIAKGKAVDLPSVFSQPALAATSNLESSVSHEKSNLKDNRPRLLIVDDEPINLRVVEMILSTKEYNMTGVTSGSQALDLLGSQEWDLVISDVMMPHMSGYELTREFYDDRAPYFTPDSSGAFQRY